MFLIELSRIQLETEARLSALALITQSIIIRVSSSIFILPLDPPDKRLDESQSDAMPRTALARWIDDLFAEIPKNRLLCALDLIR